VGKQLTESNDIEGHHKMNSSNQDKVECHITYDPNVALEFFKLFGTVEAVKAGKPLFALGQKAGVFSFLQTDKIYLLLDGTVTVQTMSGNLINLESGQVFGEFTPYTANNATATASTACKLVVLSEKQFIASLKKQPTFLFMLMDVLIRTLPKTGTEPKDTPLIETKISKPSCVLSTEMLNTLKQKLGENALMNVPEKRVVFHEGAAALLMYVILEGQMTIMIDNKVVGRSGVGDIVGEIALVARRHARTASVIAETRCLLLAIDRQTLPELIQSLPAFGISLLRVLDAHLNAIKRNL
jgi:CRP-like cAMP-binding protein